MRHSLLTAVCLSAVLAGCGEGFDPPSEVTSLRLLALQKDKPYAQPGETVNVRLLWHDGSLEPLEQEPRDIEIRWITGCTNPAADAYFGCFAPPNLERIRLEELDADGDGNESTASFVVNPAVLAERPPPDEGQPLFGRSLVFFTLCAGTVSLEPSRQRGALPLVCRNESGERMGPSSFAVGYSTVLTYAGTNQDGAPFENANPVARGFEVEGEAVQDFCVDSECFAEQPAPVDCSIEPKPKQCVRACAGDGEADDCPEIKIRPLVDPESAEVDEVSRVFFGRNYLEQMWINYYVDRGSVSGDGVRLLNDATKGWNDDYGTEFFAPREPGPVTLWAVIHDDRGGMSWVRTRLQVEAAE